jgi:hypothetical protein
MQFPRSSERFDLLGTEANRELLAQALARATSSVIIFSGYLTTHGLRWISDAGLKNNVHVSVVTQWSPGDLLSGASDLGAFAFCQKRKWSLLLLPQLHGKLVLVDKMYLFVGSANITAHGLSLVPGAHRELGLCVAANSADLTSILGLLSQATEVSSATFEAVQNWLKNNADILPPPPVPEWPPSISALLRPSYKRLWVADLPWSEPDWLLGLREPISDYEIHDRRLFAATSINSFSTAFVRSTCFQWLLGTLEDEPEKMAYFGKLTHLLHEALLDDPAPYRRDVKTLLSNLLLYAGQFAKEQIRVDRPNQSMRVTLINFEKRPTYGKRDMPWHDCTGQ